MALVTQTNERMITEKQLPPTRIEAARYDRLPI